jgi:uncharacterized protein (DUF2147 family)
MPTGVSTKKSSMRMAIASLAAMLCLTSVPSPTRAADAAASVPTNPLGVWATEGGGARVKIEDCAGKLCGSLIWLKEPLDKQGQDKVDSENPDPGLRSRKLLGLRLLNGFVSEGDGTVWSDGTIYNPDDGKTYSCKLTMQDARTMKVRGFIGISLLGKTQVWNRFE